MHWIIQSSGIRRPDNQVHSLLDGLGRAGVTWSDVGVIPFTNEITNGESIPLDRPVFLHCGTKLVRILTDPSVSASEIFPYLDPAIAEEKRAVLRRSLFYDERGFNMAHQFTVNTESGPLRGFLANGHGIARKLSEELDVVQSTEVFIKPASDLKLFDGCRVKAGETLREVLSKKTVNSRFKLAGAEDVIVAPIKEILAEYRFFVWKDELVGWSQYKKFDELVPHPHVPEHVVMYARHLAKLYKPALAFVMDVWLMGDLELKIGEYNCFNCSGLYKVDVSRLASLLNSG